jgi:hypothetical protein
MKSGKNNSHRNGNSGTLTSQIQEIERQIMHRHHYAHLHTDALVRDLQKEMTSATTLLLASELGFIVGELTKRPPKNERQSAKPDTDGKLQAEVTPLEEALDLSTLLLGLYRALPWGWIIDTFHPTEEASKTGTVDAAAKTGKVNLAKK